MMLTPPPPPPGDMKESDSMNPVPASIERTKPYVLVVGRVSEEKLQA